MTTFLDTNIMIYLLDEQAEYHVWSTEQLALCKTNGPAIVSDIVYCEMAVGMASKAEVDEAIERFALERISSTDEVLYRAAVAFRKYKDNGGPKIIVLPDFLVGAVADVSGASLMTVNGGDFTHYFPDLEVISPP